MKKTITNLVKPVAMLAIFATSGVNAIAQAPPTLVSTVSGKVWMETDGIPADGIQNGGEGNVAGILVRMITGTGSGPGATTVGVGMTDASGNYTIENYHGTGNFTIRFEYPNQGFTGVSPVGGASESHVSASGTATINVASDGDNKTVNMGLVRNLSYIVRCGTYSGSTEWSQNITLQKFDYTARGVSNSSLQLWSAGYSNHRHVQITENSAPGTPMPTAMNLRVGIQSTVYYPDFPSDTLFSTPLVTASAMATTFTQGQTKHYYNQNAWQVFSPQDVDYAPVNTGSGIVSVPVNVNGQAVFTGSTNFLVSLPTTAAFGACLIYNLSSPLNVSFVSINAGLHNGMPKLEWKTSAEKDSRGFEIEHSLDGKFWSNIGFVASKGENGNSVEQLSYDFDHQAASIGKNFYRLNQVDHDGNSTLSKVVAVVVGSSATVSIYPTVIEQHNTAFNIEGLSGNSEISVFNLNGSRVAYFSSINSIEIVDMSRAAAGLYTVVVRDFETATVKTQKIIKK